MVEEGEVEEGEHLQTTQQQQHERPHSSNLGTPKGMSGDRDSRYQDQSKLRNSGQDGYNQRDSFRRDDDLYAPRLQRQKTLGTYQQQDKSYHRDNNSFNNNMYKNNSNRQRDWNRNNSYHHKGNQFQQKSFRDRRDYDNQKMRGRGGQTSGYNRERGFQNNYRNRDYRFQNQGIQGGFQRGQQGNYNNRDKWQQQQQHRVDNLESRRSQQYTSQDDTLDRRRHYYDNNQYNQHHHPSQFNNQRRAQFNPNEVPLRSNSKEFDKRVSQQRSSSQQRHGDCHDEPMPMNIDKKSVHNHSEDDAQHVPCLEDEKDDKHEKHLCRQHSQDVEQNDSLQLGEKDSMEIDSPVPSPPLPPPLPENDPPLPENDPPPPPPLEVYEEPDPPPPAPPAKTFQQPPHLEKKEQTQQLKNDHQQQYEIKQQQQQYYHYDYHQQQQQQVGNSHMNQYENQISEYQRRMHGCQHPKYDNAYRQSSQQQYFGYTGGSIREPPMQMYDDHQRMHSTSGGIREPAMYDNQRYYNQPRMHSSNQKLQNEQMYNAQTGKMQTTQQMHNPHQPPHLQQMHNPQQPPHLQQLPFPVPPPPMQQVPQPIPQPPPPPPQQESSQQQQQQQYVSQPSVPQITPEDVHMQTSHQLSQQQQKQNDQQVFVENSTKGTFENKTSIAGGFDMIQQKFLQRIEKMGIIYKEKMSELPFPRSLFEALDRLESNYDALDQFEVELSQDEVCRKAEIEQEQREEQRKQQQVRAKCAQEQFQQFKSKHNLQGSAEVPIVMPHQPPPINEDTQIIPLHVPPRVLKKPVDPRTSYQYKVDWCKIPLMVPFFYTLEEQKKQCTSKKQISESTFGVQGVKQGLEEGEWQVCDWGGQVIEKGQMEYLRACANGGHIGWGLPIFRVSDNLWSVLRRKAVQNWELCPVREDWEDQEQHHIPLHVRCHAQNAIWNMTVGGKGTEKMLRIQLWDHIQKHLENSTSQQQSTLGKRKKIERANRGSSGTQAETNHQRPNTRNFGRYKNQIPIHQKMQKVNVIKDVNHKPATEEDTQAKQKQKVHEQLVYVDKLLNFSTQKCESAFNEPVDEKDAPGYKKIITNPMDLGTIREKIMVGNQEWDQILIDINLVVTNCLKYNPKGNIYHDFGVQLDKQAQKLFQQIKISSQQ